MIPTNDSATTADMGMPHQALQHEAGADPGKHRTSFLLSYGMMKHRSLKTRKPRSVTGSASLVAVLSVLALAPLAPQARADTLTLGNVFHPFYASTDATLRNYSHVQDAGGNMQGVLSGELLAGTYCVNLLNPVYLGGSYPTTTVSTDGTMFGGAVPSAGVIAWLLTTYGNSASTVDEQNALAGGDLASRIWQIIPG